MRLSFSLIALLAVACGYEPPLDAGANEVAPSVALSGELVNAGAGNALGPTMVFRYSALEPPLPESFGRPYDLSTVPESAWQRPVDHGLEVADWKMAGVGAGSWLITALVDVDRDFNPFYDFTTSATCGDRLGAFVESTAATGPAVLSVGIDDDPDTIPIPSAVDGLEILVGDALAIERPVFTLSEQTPSVSRSAATPQGVVLEITGVDHPLLEVPDPDDTEGRCDPAFWIELVDADGDGEIDPHPNESLAAAGRKDVWPRVYMATYADADGVPTDPDLDPEAVPWVSELTVSHEVYQFGGYGAGDLFASDSLSVIFTQAGARVEADGSQTLFYGEDLPAGPWSLIAVAQTGQMWQIPNQLGAELEDFDVTPHADQAVALIVE